MWFLEILVKLIQYFLYNIFPRECRQKVPDHSSTADPIVCVSLCTHRAGKAENKDVTT